MTLRRARPPRLSAAATQGDAPGRESAAQSHTTGPARSLQQLGLGVRRRFSQNFLTDPAIARAVVAAADLQLSDTVLEIGPGLGALTRHLVLAARRVVAIELDRGLASALKSDLGDPANLEVVQGDALTINIGALVVPPFTVVANLPYHVASPILFRLLFEEPRPTRIVAMLQEEVAERVAGRYHRATFLGTAVATVAEARIVRRVAPGSFYPAPKVRSAVVRLDLRDEPVVPREELAAFLDFLRAGFAQPRKQLRNSLAAGLGSTPARAAALATAAGVAPTSRPEQLTPSAWASMYRVWREASRDSA